MVDLVIKFLRSYQDIVQNQIIVRAAIRADSSPVGAANRSAVESPPIELPTEQIDEPPINDDQLKILEELVNQDPDTEANLDSEKLKGCINLLQSFKNLGTRLEEFKRVLMEEEDEDNLEPAAIEAAKHCDDLWSACLVYLDFIHPVWIETNRKSGSIDHDFVEKRKQLLDKILLRDRHKLETKFKSLMASSEGLTGKRPA